jgi:hypothetical protein
MKQTDFVCHVFCPESNQMLAVNYVRLGEIMTCQLLNDLFHGLGLQ